MGKQRALMPSSRKMNRSIAYDETFVRLIQVAQEEPEIGNRLKSILTQDDFNRKSMINTWIEELKLQKAPSDFIKELSYFLDESVARSALDMLGDE